MRKEIIEILVETKQANKSVKKLDKQINDLDKQITKTNKDSKKGFEGLTGSLNKVTKGFKGMGLALKGAGIAAVIGLFSTLKDLVTENSTVVKGFSTAYEFVSILFSDVATALGNVIERISSVKDNFDALGKVLTGIKNAVLQPFINSWTTIQLGIANAQLAWEKSFFGNKDQTRIKELTVEIEGLNKELVKGTLEFIQANDMVVDNFSEAVDEIKNMGSIVVDEMSKISLTAIGEQAKRNVELRRAAEIGMAENDKLLKQYMLEAELLRQQRDDVRLGIDERIRANNKLGEVLKKQERVLLDNNKKRMEIADIDLAKDAENIEFQRAKIEAETDLMDIRETAAGFRSEQLTNEAALDQEKLDMINTTIEAESRLAFERQKHAASLLEDDLERLNLLKKINAEQTRVEGARMLKSVEQHATGTQLKADAEVAYTEFLQQQAIERDNLNKEYDEADLNRKKENKDKTKILDQESAEMAQNIQAMSLSAISSLITAFENQNEKNAEKAFKMQKALGIVETLINTSVAIMRVARETADPIGPLRLANMIAMGVAGAAQVAAIASQKFQPSGTSGGTAPSPSLTTSGASESQAPQFNIVGQSGFNQVAQAIGQQQPVQAFVVAQDVTTAQQLENNIISTATVGG